MTEFDRDQLIELFRERAIRFGEFTLASGRKSTYYVDKMQITLHSLGLAVACHGLTQLLADVEYDAVGGMTIGADPIVGGLLTIAAAEGRELEGFLVRKEPKGHGTRQFIEGPLQPGQRVVIVEDVVTTGGSAIAAIDRVEEFGAQVVQVVAIVDRLEGGAATFAERGVAYRSLLTIEDFGISPPANTE